MAEQELFDKKRLSAFFSLIRFDDVVSRYMEIEFARFGSNPMRMIVLNALYSNGGSLSPTELSKFIFRTRHSITSMIDTLEKQNLVRRKPNPKDRRSIIVSMTAKGRRTFEKMMPVGYRLSNEALSCLDDDEIEYLQIIQKRLRERMLAIIGKHNE
jgi:DNA-binding MarR family transcriptional regulator